MVAIPNGDRRAERREATRQEILGAAWEVARTSGIAGLTLREVAVRVRMQPPSLYSHFESKNAIYDAMFEQAWRTYLADAEQHAAGLPASPRARLAGIATHFFDFAVADPARAQLMNMRVVPDFEPSPWAYAAATACYERMRQELTAIGITRAADLDLFTALIAGLASQQIANDPGGTRWRRQLTRVMTMLADDVGLPSPRSRTSGRKR